MKAITATVYMMCQASFVASWPGANAPERLAASVNRGGLPASATQIGSGGVTPFPRVAPSRSELRTPTRSLLLPERRCTVRQQTRLSKGTRLITDGELPYIIVYQSIL